MFDQNCKTRADFSIKYTCYVGYILKSCICHFFFWNYFDGRGRELVVSLKFYLAFKVCFVWCCSYVTYSEKDGSVICNCCIFLIILAYLFYYFLNRLLVSLAICSHYIKYVIL